MRQEEICYHHYSLTFDPSEIQKRFSDVRFVLIAGCVNRVEAQASYLAENLFNGSVLGRFSCDRLTKASSRFALFQVGPVLVSNHGIGAASMSIAMHELILMCQQADVAHKITLIRFGTCGGIGVPPGTLCITNKALNPLFQDYVELRVCMRVVRRDCVVDLETAAELQRVASKNHDDDALGEYQVRSGATVATDDFYEEQGRCNGAICEHSLEDKARFLEQARDLGVVNIEMESNFLFAMCHKLNISCGVVCVALTDRLVNDKVHLTSKQMVQFEQRLFWTNLQFIKHKISLAKGTTTK